ncbi:FKBP-type peptidyl-prolyl cis-trans isomerase [Mucilaginibacter sp.]
MKKIFLLFGFLTVLFSACKKQSFNNSLQATIDDEKIQKFITANNITGLTKDPSGIYYKIETSNPGPHPTATDTVQVSYTGRLLNGTVFDTESATIVGLPDAIKGWQIALPFVGVNGSTPYGRIRMIIPSALAYGSAEQSSIPANSVLDFTIDVEGFY